MLSPATPKVAVKSGQQFYDLFRTKPSNRENGIIVQKTKPENKISLLIQYHWYRWKFYVFIKREKMQKI